MKNGLWHEIPSLCVNCGAPLMARFDHDAAARSSFLIDGCLPVEYTHAHGRKQCAIFKTARGFSDWDTNRQLERLEHDPSA